jgi:prevent-host-death family protein
MFFRNEKWVNVRTLRRELSHWMSEAAYEGQRVIVALHGRPRVAIVSLRDLNRLRGWQREAMW